MPGLCLRRLRLSQASGKVAPAGNPGASGVRVAINQPIDNRPAYMAVEVMQSRSISEVVASWIADRSLSRRKKAFLETVYSQFVDTGGIGVLDVAGHAYASELDLPPGSFTIQVVAALLDHVDPWPAPGRRLVEVTDQLLEWEVIDHETAQATYEAAL